MKLLFTQDALVNAGAERSHLEILSRFSKEVDVGFVYFYPKHELRKAYKRAGIRLFFLDIPEAYHLPLAVFRLVKLIQTEKPDLLISSLWRADIITRIASLLTRVPLVGTLVNDSYAPIAWADKKGLKYKVVYWLDRLTAGIPVHWIANAQALADSHVKTLGLSREKITVVYRGRPVIAGNVIASAAKQSFKAINSTNETASAAESSDVNSELSDSSLAPVPIISGVTGATDAVIASDEGAKQSSLGKIASHTDWTGLPMKGPKGMLAMTRNFISYGRLLERKGFQNAIRAFAQVQKIYPDCTLTIFGEGPYRGHLEKLVQELDLNSSVFLPGKISNPVDLLNSDLRKHRTSDIGHPTSFHYFLFPSWYEGFSGALVEAMMAGIPIIASDIPMNLEAIEDGKSGLVFPVTNVTALAKQMTWAIENPKLMLSLGINARIIAEERFDIEKIAKIYEATLFSIAGSKTSTK